MVWQTFLDRFRDQGCQTVLVWQTFPDRFRDQGCQTDLVQALTENVILWRNTQIACGFGRVPVLIHRKEKILSGGFQV